MHDLNLMDRFLFAEAADDKEFLEIVLSIIFDENISLIFPPQTEKEQRRNPSNRNIRVDVYAEDELHQIYDTEVQKKDEKNLPHRTRYYNGMIDINLMNSGEIDFNELNDLYIVVIASFDIFKKGLYKYTVKRRCLEYLNWEYYDGSTFIFLNTTGTNPRGVSDELISMLKYFENSNREVAEASGSERIMKLQEKVEAIRNNSEIGVKFMCHATLSSYRLMHSSILRH